MAIGITFVWRARRWQDRCPRQRWLWCHCPHRSQCCCSPGPEWPLALMRSFKGAVCQCEANSQLWLQSEPCWGAAADAVTAVRSPRAGYMDWALQHLHQPREGDAAHREPQPRMLWFLGHSNGLNLLILRPRKENQLLHYQHFKFCLASVIPRGDIFLCVYFWHEGRKALKYKIISLLSPPAATMNSQVTRDHTSMRHCNRYFVIIFVECVFWELQFGALRGKNLSGTAHLHPLHTSKNPCPN